jgi:nickel-dependent lactate racemase
LSQVTKLAIPYSQEQQTVEIATAHSVTLAIPPEPIVAAADAIAAVQEALANPIGSPPLSQLVRAGQKVAIVVSDFTRPTPSGLILGPVLAELHSAGIIKQNIIIVIACGLHVPSPLKNQEIMLGKQILAEYQVVNHLADDESMKYVGTTSGGIPVKINKIVAEADLIISIGAVDPHHWAGFSGGGKNLLPGVSSRETVNAHHILLMDPHTGVGQLAGNKFRQQLEEAARLAKFNFIINVVLSPDKKIAFVAAGDVVEAHRACTDYSASKLQVTIAEQADIVIASPGGFPRDSTFWQTDGKCVSPIAPVVKDGGIAIIVSRCDKGFGDDEFANLLGTKNFSELETALKQGPFSTALAKAYNFARLAQRVQIYLVTEGISSELLPHIPLKSFTSLASAVAAALAQQPDATLLVVPDSASIVLKLKNEK